MATNNNHDNDIWVFKRIQNKRFILSDEDISVIDLGAHTILVPGRDKSIVNSYVYMFIKDLLYGGYKAYRYHRFVWMYYYGLIPKDHDIHHRDSNKINNHHSNLQCLTVADHHALHSVGSYPHVLFTEAALLKGSITRTNNLNKVDNLISSGYKRCPACDDIKPLSEFAINNYNRTGYAAWCKFCINSKNNSIKQEQGIITRAYQLELISQNKKYCTKCKVIKDLDKFKPSRILMGNATSWCRDCLNKYNNDRYHNLKNPK